jgi:superoxide reductase
MYPEDDSPLPFFLSGFIPESLERGADSLPRSLFPMYVTVCNQQEDTMSQTLEVYKCATCGNLIEVLHTGGGPLACCDQPMKLMKEGSTDGAREKHLPVVEKTATGYKVKVGSVPHPMEEAHFIQWIELVADGVSYTRFLKPGAPAEAEFVLKADTVHAREFCNLHGHWKS